MASLAVVLQRVLSHVARIYHSPRPRPRGLAAAAGVAMAFNLRVMEEVNLFTPRGRGEGDEYL